MLNYALLLLKCRVFLLEKRPSVACLFTKMRPSEEVVPECDVPLPGIPGTRNFSLFLVVSEPVSEQIGIGKKSRNLYRNKFDIGTDVRRQNLESF